MAFTSQQIVDYLLANPGMTDAQIVAAMETFQISPAQMAAAVNLDEGAVASRVAATVPQGQTITLGDTIIQPVYQTTGSGMDQQVGGLENVITYKATDNKAGGAYTQYTPTGEVEKTGTQQEVKSGLKEFAIGAALLFTLPTLLNAGAVGAPAIGNGAFLGEGVASGIPAFDTAFTSAGGVFNPAFGLPVGNGAFLGEGVLSGVPASDLALANATVGATNLTAAQIAALTAQDLAIGGGALAGTAPATIPGLLTPAATTTATTAATTLGSGASTTLGGAGSSLSGLTAGSSLSGLTAGSSLSGLTAGAGALTGANTLLGGAGLGTTLSGLGAGASLLGTAATGLGAKNLANLLSGGLGTAGSLLQMQQSKEAAQKAQAMIDAETAAAKQSAAFRPIGMTTRFGTSQFAVDPVTGQLTSAGYTLSPEAKNAQDRLVKLAESGLVQAEGAQQAFAPLQTGAQSLFGLGNKYLAQSPEDVAKNYLAQQMALLQPGRELELANLQNRLQQQGRGGLSVAQGGTLGATTPELQALFNARVQQEAVLAAQAQQAGQQQVAFGAGLLGTGAQTMGQYYGGQQAAYSPYTTALGQVQNLESMAQQPLQMGASLGQQASTAGARVGQLGLQGAGQSVALATGADATRSLGAQSLIAAGNPNAMFGQSLGNVFGGLFDGGTSATPAFGTADYYANQLGSELGFSVASQPTGTRQTGPMDVNTADLARRLGINLPANYTGTTTTVNPLLANQQYSF